MSVVNPTVGVISFLDSCSRSGFRRFSRVLFPALFSPTNSTRAFRRRGVRLTKPSILVSFRQMFIILYDGRWLWVALCKREAIATGDLQKRARFRSAVFVKCRLNSAGFSLQNLRRPARLIDINKGALARALTRRLTT